MLELTETTREMIVEHARECFPEESCGLLAGEYDEHCSIADMTLPAENTSSVPDRRYEIAPEDQFELMTAIEERGRDVVGFYHSHPCGPDHPSETDENMATWDGYSYVIVSLSNESPSVGSWRWNGHSFDRESVNVSED